MMDLIDLVKTAKIITIAGDGNIYIKDDFYNEFVENYMPSTKKDNIATVFFTNILKKFSDLTKYHPYCYLCEITYGTFPIAEHILTGDIVRSYYVFLDKIKDSYRD